MNTHAVPNATLGLPGRPANGGSCPRFYEFDDGVTRLVKWHPSRHGHKACYNELIVSRIGQLLAAPILRGAIVYVADDVIPDDHRGDGATPGFHFSVTRMDGDNFVPTNHYAEIENSSELPVAAVFLAWLNVQDQQGHNQFLQRLQVRSSSGSLHLRKLFRLIDMGKAFGNWNWTAESILAIHSTYRLPTHMLPHLSWQNLRPALAQIADLSDVSIEACLKDTPESWNVNADERGACAKRIIASKTRVEAILRLGNPKIPETK